MNRKWQGLWAALAAALFALSACPTHKVKVEPVEVKPIHVTVDVNIKVDKELDRFFDFEEDLEKEEGAPDGESPKNEGEGT